MKYKVESINFVNKTDYMPIPEVNFWGQKMTNFSIEINFTIGSDENNDQKFWNKLKKKLAKIADKKMKQPRDK